ncbi:hypothetical protein MMC29_001113 [Sticta canariensis]|nr:hypothetical protein [Sticta canariensis]
MILRRKQELLGIANSSPYNPNLGNLDTNYLDQDSDLDLSQLWTHELNQQNLGHNLLKTSGSRIVNFLLLSFNFLLRPNFSQAQPPPPLQLQFLYRPQGDATNQYSREQTLLDKIYKEEDKLSGTGDNLDFKAYIHGALIMLSGLYANGSSASTFERDEFKKRFAGKHLDYKRRPRYDQKSEQYITDYKGSDDDHTVQFFEELSIDTTFNRPGSIWIPPNG